MFGKSLLGLLLPLALAAGLGACDNYNNSVQPGVVNTAAQGGYRGETGRVVSIREVPVRNRSSGETLPCRTYPLPASLWIRRLRSIAAVPPSAIMTL